jgi:hypothetical protein
MTAIVDEWYFLTKTVVIEQYFLMQMLMLQLGVKSCPNWPRL